MKTIKEESLSDKRVKIYSGDIIEGCEEWYYYYLDINVKETVKKLKEEITDIKCKCEDCQDLRGVIDKIFGDKLTGKPLDLSGKGR